MFRRMVPFRFLMLAVLLYLSSACSAAAPAPPAAPSTPAPTASLASYRPTPVRRFDPAGSMGFQRISVEQGLSQSSVRSIVQDSRDFVWFGTEDGLNRYDGSGFQVFKHDPGNPATIGSNAVNALLQDSMGALWVGLEAGGLDRYDPGTRVFKHYGKSSVSMSGLTDEHIYALYEDKNGVLWVGTGAGLNAMTLTDGLWRNYVDQAMAPRAIQRGLISSIYASRNGTLWFGTVDGLIRYDRAANNFKTYRSDPADPQSLSSNSVWAIAEDAAGALWVGTMGGGLSILDPATDQFNRYPSRGDDPTTISSNNISAIRMDRSGTMWVGTYDGGINRFDSDRKRFFRYARQADNPASLSTDNIRSLYEDRAGNLWIGTFGGGVNMWDPSSARFVHYRSQLGQVGSLSHNMVLAVYPESKDLLWVGTQGGLDRLDRRAGLVEHYRHSPQNDASLGHDYVRAILRDHFGTLWVGTEGGGLNQFDAEEKGFDRYLHDDNDPASLSSNTVSALYEDPSGVLWVGTGWGLDRLNRATGTFTHYKSKADEPQISSWSYIQAISPERSGGLWLATANGLIKFDPSTGRMTRYVHNPQDANSLSGDFVLAVYQDRSGTVWTGTFTQGLNKLDPVTGKFTHYREKQGLPSDTVYSILEDGGGFLWMSTNKGIARFDPRKETFLNYDAADGLQGNEFNLGASSSSAHGEMFFGGTNGLTAFYPQEITEGPDAPSIVVTQLTRAGEPLHLDQAAESVREFSLTWPDNYFEFEFAAPGSPQADKFKYAYLLEGFDQRWNEVGSRHAGRYTNLPGGTYTLRIAASSGGTVLPEGAAALRITVIPPFWDSWWFRGSLGFLILSVAFVAYRLRVRDIRMRNLALERKLDESTWALRQQTTELLHNQQRLDALYRADTEMYKHLEKVAVLNALVDVAVDICHADKSAVVMWDDKREEWAVSVARGFSPETVALLHFRKDEGVVGMVTSSGQALTVDDAVQDPRREYERADVVEAVLREGVHSFMQIPIMLGGKVFAVFNVNFAEPRAIGEEEQKLFLALAQRAERALENARLFNTETRRAEQFQAIAEAGRLISALLNTDEILRQVSASIQQRFGYYHVAIGLVEGDEVVYRVGSGMLWDDADFHFTPARLKIGREGITGWVAAHGEPLIVPDVGEDPRYVWLQGSATRSELTVPILVKGQVIGVLDVQSDKLNAFDSTDLAVVQALANQTSAAIENARLYERAQELAVMQERTRLARDLHDAVTQTLFSASLLADALPPTWDKDPNEGRQLLKELRQLSRGALAEMRTLLLELRPASLVETKLGGLLKQLGEAAAGREGLPVNVKVTGDRKLPADAHLALYRIAQEALNNIVKHARATRIEIDLCCEQTSDGLVVHLSVSDDGRGFDQTQVPPGHFGIGNMLERARAIGAELKISSEPGRGTRIDVTWKSKEGA